MKKTISATIDVNLAKWLDKELKKSDVYRNKSHLIEAAILEMKKRGK